jgi:hypothetical protein
MHWTFRLPLQSEVQDGARRGLKKQAKKAEKSPRNHTPSACAMSYPLLEYRNFFARRFVAMSFGS